jgi:glutamine synthetase
VTVTRDALKVRLEQDAIEYLLVQFVDIHGSPKVKMVPAECVDDVADVGAGFAGGAVWGVGQDASSHDMMARIDPPSYTPLPWRLGLARFASDLYVDGKPHPYCPRVNLKRVLGDLRDAGYVFNVGIEPDTSWSRGPPTVHQPWDPAVDGCQAVLRFRHGRRRLSAEMTDALNKLAGASTRPTTRTPTPSSRSTSSTPTP